MQELPPKKDVALFLLQRSSVFIHLDPRSEDVIVPAGFKREPRLVLQIGHNMAVPIPDLAIEEDGWSGTLSFRRVPFRCVVPWTSVFAMVGQDGQGMVWPDDVPPELAQPQRPAEPKVALAPAPAPAPASSPDLEEAEADAKPAAKAKAKRARKKGEKEATIGPAPSPTPVPAPAPAAAPALAAAPAGPASSGDAPDAAASDADAGGESPAAKPAQPGAPGKGGKPKRELPPYLRVIK